MGIVPGVIGATAGSASGSLSESGDEAGPNPRAEVEEVLRMALAWLRRADPYSFPAAGGNSEQGAAGRPPAGHKVGYLLSGRHRMCCCTHKAVQDQGQALFCFQSASLHWCHIDCVPMPLMLKIGQGCAHRTGDVMMANNAQLAAAEWDYCIKCELYQGNTSQTSSCCCQSSWSQLTTPLQPTCSLHILLKPHDWEQLQRRSSGCQCWQPWGC